MILLSMETKFVPICRMTTTPTKMEREKEADTLCYDSAILYLISSLYPSLCAVLFHFISTHYTAPLNSQTRCSPSTKPQSRLNSMSRAEERINE